MRNLNSSLKSAERTLKIDTVTRHIYKEAIMAAERYGENRYVYSMPITQTNMFERCSLPSTVGVGAYYVYIYNTDILEIMDAILIELRTLFEGQSVEYKIATLMRLRNGSEEDVDRLDEATRSEVHPNNSRKEHQIIIDWS
jgi:hypothetical protein